MIYKKYLSVLACPNCKNDIKEIKNFLQCITCKKKYKLQNGISQLIEGEKEKDVILSESKWENIYKKQSLHRDFKKDKTVLSYKKFVSKYKKYYKDGIYLDLGCGIAWNSALLAKEGVSIIGIDISYESLCKSIMLFKQEKVDGCFIQGDLLNLPIKDNSISFIYSVMSLEYVRDTQKALDEIYRILKPGGVMVAVFPVLSFTTLTYHQLRGDIPRLPLIHSFWELLHIQILKGRFMHYGYEQSFSIGFFKKLIKNANLTLQDIGCFDTFYPLAFIPDIMRSYVRKILRYRFFWPLLFVEVVKKKHED